MTHGDRRVRRERAAVDRDLALVLRLHQVLERLRRVRDERLVVADRDGAPVVAHPVAARVLQRARDRLVVRVEVLRVQTLVRACDRERDADVDDIRRTRVALERANRLVLLRGAAVGVVVRDADAVLLREGRRAARLVVRPVGRQGDRVQVPFLLRRLDERRAARPPSSFVGGAARPRTRRAERRAGAPEHREPKAAAALRRSIDERLMPSSSSLAQNSTSWAS